MVSIHLLRLLFLDLEAVEQVLQAIGAKSVRLGPVNETLNVGNFAKAAH